MEGRSSDRVMTQGSKDNDNQTEEAEEAREITTMPGLSQERGPHDRKLERKRPKSNGGGGGGGERSRRGREGRGRWKED